MRLGQYAYFGIYSSIVSAAEIEDRLGIAPDRTLVRGSKSADPPIPSAHMWSIQAPRDQRLDGQVANVLTRVANVEASLLALLPDLGPGGGCVLQLVRYFNDSDQPDTGEDGLGFHLELAWLQLLTRLDASIDVDEYDAGLAEATLANG